MVAAAQRTETAQSVFPIDDSAAMKRRKIKRAADGHRVYFCPAGDQIVNGAIQSGQIDLLFLQKNDFDAATDVHAQEGGQDAAVQRHRRTDDGIFTGVHVGHDADLCVRKCLFPEQCRQLCLCFFVNLFREYDRGVSLSF